MKFWITIIVGALLASAATTALFVLNEVGADAPPVAAAPAPLPANGDLPKAFAERVVEKYDNLPQGYHGTTPFKLRNDGRAPLTLEADRPSCTCTDVKVGKATLEPGEETTVTLEWDTKERVGPFSVNAPIKTNDPAMPRLVFSLNLEVRPDVLLSAQDLFFGHLQETDKAEQSFFVYSTRHKDVKVKELKMPTPAFQGSATPIEPAELEKLKATSGQKITVKLDGALPVGEFQYTMVFTTNYDNGVEKPIPLRGSVRGAITVSPPSVELNATSPEDLGKERRVAITGKLRDVTLSIADCPKPLRARVVRDAKSPALWWLYVALAPDAEQGPFNAVVTLVDDKGAKRVSYSVRGVVAASQTGT